MKSEKSKVGVRQRVRQRAPVGKGEDRIGVKSPSLPNYQSENEAHKLVTKKLMKERS